MMGWLLAALLVKHWLADFPLQRHQYLYAHKGKYGHSGGIMHAMVHVMGTWAVMLCFFGIHDPDGVHLIWLPWLDGVLHYHIDWAKARITKARGWSGMVQYGRPHLAIYSQNYFEAIGPDQLLHHLTYVLIAWLAC